MTKALLSILPLRSHLPHWQDSTRRNPACSNARAWGEGEALSHSIEQRCFQLGFISDDVKWQEMVQDVLKTWRGCALAQQRRHAQNSASATCSPTKRAPPALSLRICRQQGSAQPRPAPSNSTVGGFSQGGDSFCPRSRISARTLPWRAPHRAPHRAPCSGQCPEKASASAFRLPSPEH